MREAGSAGLICKTPAFSLPLRKSRGRRRRCHRAVRMRVTLTSDKRRCYDRDSRSGEQKLGRGSGAGSPRGGRDLRLAWETLHSPTGTAGSQAAPYPPPASEAPAFRRLAWGAQKVLFAPTPALVAPAPLHLPECPVTSALHNPPCAGPCEDAPLPSSHGRCGAASSIAHSARPRATFEAGCP